MKSSIDILKEIKNNSLNPSKRKSMVEKAVFKDEYDFAGSNQVLREMYKRHNKT